MAILPEFTPERGIVRLRQRELEALVSGAPAVLDADTEIGRGLVELGVVNDHRVDPALAELLEVLRSPLARFALRTQTSADLRLHRGWANGAGVATVSTTEVNDTDCADDPVLDVRFSARRTSVARVLARLLNLGPTESVDPPPKAMSWSEISDGITAAGSTWVADLFGPGAKPSLHHLRWTADPAQPARTALLLLTGGPRGIAKVLPTDDGYVLEATTSLSVWTALCGVVG